MTAIIWVNISFAMLFIALWSGIPLWMVLRYPDRHPREARTAPAYLRQRTAAGLPAPRRTPSGDSLQRRELAGANRS